MIVQAMDEFPYGGLHVRPERTPFRGDFQNVSMSSIPAIKSEGGMRYLAIDCFVDKHFEDEPTWDAHVRVLCKEQGWDYAQVVK